MSAYALAVALPDLAKHKRDRRRQRRLPVIDMTDRTDVDVRLRPLELLLSHNSLSVSCPGTRQKTQAKVLFIFRFQGSRRTSGVTQKGAHCHGRPKIATQN